MLFNKLISGLHSSISTHLSESYHDRKNKSNHNYNVYFERVANHPERLENLYFAYSLLLRYSPVSSNNIYYDRAVNIASSQISKMTIDTDNFKEDLKTKELLSLILNKTNEYCDFSIDSTKETILPISVLTNFKIQHNMYYLIQECIQK